MELEELEPSKLIGPQQDVETVESWADRNGLTCGVAHAWAMKCAYPQQAKQAPYEHDRTDFRSNHLPKGKPTGCMICRRLIA